MSIIKSFSVGDGDSIYIKHNSDNFTIIDCNYDDNNKEAIVDELISESNGKGIKRFISTHPDEDHILGLEYLNGRMEIDNFYCVENEATKTDPSTDFNKYCELRDSEKKSFYLEKDCSRKWMNLKSEERGSSGINILWPDRGNEDFKAALKQAKEGNSPNNISPIIKYGVTNGVNVIWMGDIEKDFLEKIKDDLELPKANILFAPHHGRKSGKIPQELLDDLDPDIIIIGEAPSEDLDYYKGYNTITQNTAGDIILECLYEKVHVFVSNKNYSVGFLDYEKGINSFNYYIGTLNI
jgi:beta-lactamase superfamily II metal-dependent hydrolase